MKISQEIALSIACPVCAAPAGTACHAVGQRSMSLAVGHAMRRKAAQSAVVERRGNRFMLRCDAPASVSLH